MIKILEVKLENLNNNRFFRIQLNLATIKYFKKFNEQLKNKMYKMTLKVKNHLLLFIILKKAQIRKKLEKI